MKGLIDIHCHMLPSVDDGAKDMKDAVEMLRQAYMNGTRTIILTPHFHGGRYVTSKEKILEKYMDFKQIAERASSKLTIYLGNELYYQQDLIERLDREEVFTLADSSYVLIEFSTRANYMEIKQAFQNIILGGYVPILAHVERYECLVKDIVLVEELVEMGAYIQANASSVTGDGNTRTKKFLKKLLVHELLHLIASDSHDCKYRTPGMKETYLYLAKKYNVSLANELLIKNPERIIQNEYI